jgi:beta-galactosidase
MRPRYFEELTPGHGRTKPRSALSSNAPRIDLNGDWAFRFSPTGLEDGRLELPGFHDRGRDRLPVPSHWQLHG